MIPKEILKEVRRIQITTARQVTDVFAGQYQSVFKGRGIEFDEVREYIPGDDIRSIDWNVTARTGRPFVKKFVEEREMTVFVLLDVSASTFFGTGEQMKKQLAAKICSVLALAAVKNNDKVGFIAFSDRIEKCIPPRKGMRHVLRIIREALFLSPQGRGTDIVGTLEYLNRVARRKSVVFILSDFFAPEFKKQLAIANKRHDVVAVTISDPAEYELPDIGLVKFFDPETGRDCVVDNSDPAARLAYKEAAVRRINARRRLFRSSNVDEIEVRTDSSYAASLVRFFRQRERRAR
jgi:uncharacterized protein (DUF58 family)